MSADTETTIDPGFSGYEASCTVTGKLVAVTELTLVVPAKESIAITVDADTADSALRVVANAVVRFAHIVLSVGIAKVALVCEKLKLYGRCMSICRRMLAARPCFFRL